MVRSVIGVAIVLLVAIAVMPTVRAGASREQTTAAPQAPPTSQVNLNTANAAELEKLPGVGPATAARIIEYRQKNGAFKKIEELMNVKGIGEKTFLKLKPLLTVAPPKTFA